MKQLTVLVTGASGFIGSSLCRSLSKCFLVVGIDVEKMESHEDSIIKETINLNDTEQVDQVFEKFKPDVIVHCAGIAHQRIGAVGSEDYFRENIQVTVNLTKTGIRHNPDIYFVFLSSISVYGEKQQQNLIVPKSKLITGFEESDECYPSSDYARSKLDAERRLSVLHNQRILKHLTILRLAPVYDLEWTLNLDRRVYLSKMRVFVKFGAGDQRMSALSRKNLVDFISYLINKHENDKTWLGNMKDKIGIPEKGGTKKLIINVCDKDPYSFSQIIKVFKNFRDSGKKMIIAFPLPIVWLLTRCLGMVLISKREWLHSCYDKLAKDLVYNNNRMVKTGYNHIHTLYSIFSKEK